MEEFYRLTDSRRKSSKTHPRDYRGIVNHTRIIPDSSFEIDVEIFAFFSPRPEFLIFDKIIIKWNRRIRISGNYQRQWFYIRVNITNRFRTDSWRLFSATLAALPCPDIHYPGIHWNVDYHERHLTETLIIPLSEHRWQVIAHPLIICLIQTARLIELFPKK